MLDGVKCLAEVQRKNGTRECGGLIMSVMMLRSDEPFG